MLTRNLQRWTEAESKTLCLPPPPHWNTTLIYSTAYKLMLVSLMSATEEVNMQQSRCILILKKVFTIYNKD